MSKGFAAVSMRDIAEALEVRPSSLYYHAPQGKEQLFYEATLRSLQRHTEEMKRVMEQDAPDFRAQFRALAHWSRANLDIDMVRMVQTDLREVSPEYQQLILEAFSQWMMQPLIELIRKNQAKGKVKPIMPEVLAGALLAVATWTNSLNADAQTEVVSALATDQTISMLLDGCWIGEG
ncbi:TetR/AcrR family transcriptional regulator [bacterium]|nr:TetR/AcrR family transcriptional regulator [bacterium]